MGRYFMLCEGEIVEEPDYAKWAKWYEKSYEQVRQVARTKAEYGTVSTIFLGMSMTLSQTQAPQLFETQIEGGWLEGERQRYSTLDEAKAGHESWVSRVNEAEAGKLPPPGFVW